MKQSYLVPDGIRDPLNCRNSQFILQGRIDAAFGWAMQSVPVDRRLLEKGEDLGGCANPINARATAGVRLIYKGVGRPLPNYRRTERVRAQPGI